MQSTAAGSEEVNIGGRFAASRRSHHGGVGQQREGIRRTRCAPEPPAWPGPESPRTPAAAGGGRDGARHRLGLSETYERARDKTKQQRSQPSCASPLLPACALTFGAKIARYWWDRSLRRRVVTSSWAVRRSMFRFTLSICVVIFGGLRRGVVRGSSRNRERRGGKATTSRAARMRHQKTLQGACASTAAEGLSASSPATAGGARLALHLERPLGPRGGVVALQVRVLADGRLEHVPRLRVEAACCATERGRGFCCCLLLRWRWQWQAGAQQQLRSAPSRAGRGRA